MRRLLSPELYLAVAVVVVFLGGSLTTSGFATVENTAAILLSASITGITAVAMTPMILSGHFVSIAGSASAALAAVVFVTAMGDGSNIALASLITVALLVMIGLVQGFVVSGGLNPILTTLATATVILGVLATITNGSNVSLGNSAPGWADKSLGGLQVPVYIFLVVTVIIVVLMRKTVIGRQMILFGANRETALLSGISSLRIAIVVFVIFSLGVALAGILWGSLLGVAGVGTLPNLTVNSIAAVLVGGNAIGGGVGSPIRSAGGAVLVSEATNIMLLNGASNGVQQTVVGGVVLIVVIALQIVARRAGR